MLCISAILYFTIILNHFLLVKKINGEGSLHFLSHLILAFRSPGLYASSRDIFSVKGHIANEDAPLDRNQEYVPSLSCLCT